jgi:hypothetical protein
MSRYWFKPKRYGYGARPVSWEGWALTAAAVVIFVGATMLLGRPGQVGLAGWMIWVATCCITVGGLTVISRRKTDGVWRWRWGED